MLFSVDTFHAGDGGFGANGGSISNVRISGDNTTGYKMFAGNGGSAADAQHIAGEFLSRLNYDRAPAAAIALTTDSSILTAIAGGEED